jgi:transcriptional regulator with XRE-family HTH domain/tetratricopeptide (TPR) repeat protein
MPQRPKDLSPALSPRHWFGAELRHWRTRRGLSQEALGLLVHLSAGMIGKIEKAERTCDLELAIALDAALDTGGVLERAATLVRADADNRHADADRAQSAQPAARGTDSAREVPYVAPSLHLPSSMTVLADGDFRVACRGPDGRIVFVTMPRRVLLKGIAGAGLSSALPMGLGTPPEPPDTPALGPSGNAHPVEDFRALRRSLVECDNMLGPRQLVSEVKGHIHTIQRLRQAASGRDRRDLMQVQAEYAEFCSWLCQDSGDFRAAQYWADRSVEWSTVAGDHDLTVYTMARKAQLAGDMHEGLDAIDLAEATLRIAPVHSRLLAMGTVFGAHGHALRGDESASEKAYEHALALVSTPPDKENARGRWLGPSYVEAHRARSLLALGHHDEAASVFQQAIHALPTSFRRDRGLYLARAAVAQVKASGPGQAAASGTQALAIAVTTGSARIFAELALLNAQLQPWASLEEIAEFRNALDSALLHVV